MSEAAKPDPLSDLQRLIEMARSCALSVSTQALKEHGAHYDLIVERLKDDPEYHAGYAAAVAKLLPWYKGKARSL